MCPEGKPSGLACFRRDLRARLPGKSVTETFCSLHNVFAIK